MYPRRIFVTLEHVEEFNKFDKQGVMILILNIFYLSCNKQMKRGYLERKS